MKTLLPLKRLIDPSRPITYGIVQAGPDVDGGIRYIRPVDMSGHGGVADPSELRTTSHEIAAQYRRSSVRSGDIVVSIGPSYGKTMVVPAELDGANLTQGTARVAPARNVDTGYLRWALRSRLAIAHWDASVGGATFRALNLAPLAETPIPLRGLAEQRAIADYLDAETARIDALIAKKQQLIHLLEERRVESIRSVVSGAGQPGERWRPGPVWSLSIPLSWSPKKIAWVKRTGSGTTPASGDERFYAEEGTPWVTTSELRERRINTTNKFITEEALLAHSALEVFPAGTVLIAMYGATVGRLGRLRVAATTNQACCALYGGRGLDQSFLYWWLWAYRKEIIDLSYGAGQPNISQETIRSLRIPAPDLEAQGEVANACERISRSSEVLHDRVSRQIDLLVEHRQALITAAMTGEFAAPGAA
ncbi:restriction endonuclease subunit S [Ilumatobacter sp.]|uniref:restriction endonuclease subunit S n=1 Tax=Ilumatobacter sp. TaxID=1967498 RepID=UPI003B51A9E3